MVNSSIQNSVLEFLLRTVYIFLRRFRPNTIWNVYKNIKKIAVILASVTAIAVHFSFYYGKIAVPFTIATGENPGVAAAMAIISSIIVGSFIYLMTRERMLHNFQIDWVAKWARYS